MIEINSNLEGISSMILDMQKIYMKYLEQANKIDKYYDKI